MIYSCEKLEKHRKKVKIDSNFWVGWLLLGYTRCRFEKCCLVCLLMGGMFVFVFFNDRSPRQWRSIELLVLTTRLWQLASYDLETCLKSLMGECTVQPSLQVGNLYLQQLQYLRKIDEGYKQFYTVQLRYVLHWIKIEASNGNSVLLNKYNLIQIQRSRRNQVAAGSYKHVKEST